LSFKLYTDEDVNSNLAVALRRRGYDVLSYLEAGRCNQNISDAEQFAFATEQGRTILTFNVRDYVPLDRQWKATGRLHAGIIVSARIDAAGELIRRVELHILTYDAATHYNQLLWLL
jgi:hypothetical protein